MKNIIMSIKTLTIALLLVSCSDSFLDVNVDPNNPETVTPDLILPVGQFYSAFTQERNRGSNTFGNLMMYNWSQSDGFSWYNDEFLYSVTPSFYAQNFDYPFANALKQYNALYKLEDAKFAYYKAIGQIMKAYHYNIMVDTYGDIPYSEALQRGLNPTPVYDDAQTIYEDLIVQLTAAIATINSTTATASPDLVTVDGDAMFQGDMTMWKKFANTVKLRILIRQSSMAGRDAYIQGEFAAMSSDGYLTSDVLVDLGYLNEDSKQNPKWAAFGATAANPPVVTLNNDATCATPFVLNQLTITNDPRIDYIYEKPATGHLGVVQGFQEYASAVPKLSPENVSNIGPGILKSAEMPAVLYTAAEMYLNRSEAVLKGLMAGDAKSLYESGVQASFDYLGAPNGSIYISQTKDLVAWDSSPNKLEAIITQKWIAVNGIDAIQSWFDYNRTGFPSNLPISLLASTPDRPVRLAYPSSEITSNGVNLPAQPNAFTAKIFWAN